MRGFIATILLPVAMVLVTAPAWASEGPADARTSFYEVQAGKGTVVVFKSRAPMEKFEGKTSRVSGWLEVDPDDLTAPFRLEVTVDLASFDTGMSKRNEHMRDNHLETDKYPTAVFTGGELAPGSATVIPVGGSATVQLIGILDLHGVAREMTCTTTVERPDSGTLLVEARFDVLLPDHRIERPKFLVLKLAEDQKVTVRLFLKKGSRS
jgi:polyisoprenoid-binding protein YceI